MEKTNKLCIGFKSWLRFYWNQRFKFEIRINTIYSVLRVFMPKYAVRWPKYASVLCISVRQLIPYEKSRSFDGTLQRN